jgi:hypothetical protein
MALRAHIVDPSTGKPNPELPEPEPIDPDWLKTLFAHPGISEARFPSLCRLRDHHSNPHYVNAELENLMAELSEASSLIWATDTTTPLARFLDRFATVLMVAWGYKNDLTFYTE